jgi:hypothetical protein
MTRLRCAHNIGGGHRAAFATGDYSSVARLAGASDRTNAKQFDLPASIFRFHRFLIRQRGPQVLLVVVAEDRHYHRVGTHHFLRANGEEIASRGKPHGQPQCVGQLLRHQNRIAIVNGDHLTQFFELNNRGCELVLNPLNPVATRLAARTQRWRFRRHYWVHTNRGVMLAEILAHAHHRPACSNAAHGLWPLANLHQLCRDFRTGGLGVRIPIRAVRELPVG